MKRLGHSQRAILAQLDGGHWIKGRELADRLGVPHTVIWPYIERLRDRGFEIEACNVRGYRIVNRIAA